MITRSQALHGVAPWLRFARTIAGVGSGLTAALFAFILLLDPYGSRTGPGRRPTPIMEVNQRYMYPQLARSGLFDAAVFGTSTLRLLKPERLNEAYGARFANLGMNGATPWEQLQMAQLFLRHVPVPKVVVMGLDRTWCDLDADSEAKRLTFRSFPAWLFDEDPVNDVTGAFSLHALELAGRVALNRLGFMPERIRNDGYEYFLPPERRYDLRRARQHIYDPAENPAPIYPPDLATKRPLPFPALAWLDRFLGQLRPETRTLLVLPPIHVAAQAPAQSPDAGIDRACKERLTEIARRHGRVLADFRLDTSVTREDGNYWDKLHYRLPVADWLMDSLKAASETGRDDPAGAYRVLSAGRL